MTKHMATYPIHHLALILVLVTWFKEHSFLIIDELGPFFNMENVDFFGEGSTISLLNINTTLDMLGLAFGLSCTHKSPT